MKTDQTGISEQIWVWRPNAIAGWSLLLTPIFGAWLTYLNWLTLGETDRAATSRYWLTGSMLWITSSAILVSMEVDPEYLIVAMVAYVIFLMAWYLAENRIQHSYIRSRSGNGLGRRRWLKPLSIALCIFAVFQLAFWGTYASRLSRSPKCTYEHTVGSMADYRTESWNFCW
jgi:hypothetical protein